MKRILSTIGTQATIQLIGLVSGVLVARLAGVEGRGELAAIIAWASAMTYLGDLGLPVAYAYSAARAPDRVSELLGNAIVATILQWLAIGVVGTAVMVVVLSSIGSDSMPWALAYLWMYVPLNLITRYLIAIYQGFGRFASFNLVRVSVPFAYLLLLVVLSCSNRASVEWILVAALVSNLSAAILAVVFMAATRPRARPYLAFNRDILLQDLRYGLRAHLGTVEPLNGLRIDVLVLTVLASTHDLGLYSVAISAFAALKALGAAFGLVALPEVARATDWPQKKHIAARIFWAALLVVGVTALTIGIWAESLVTAIYGHPFATATSLVQVMLVGAAANALYALLRDILHGLGQPLRSSLPEAVSLAVSIPALAILVPVWGVLGSAWAVAAGSLCGLAAAAVSLKRAGALGSREARTTDLAVGLND